MGLSENGCVNHIFPISIILVNPSLAHIPSLAHMTTYYYYYCYCYYYYYYTTTTAAAATTTFPPLAHMQTYLPATCKDTIHPLIPTKQWATSLI